MSRRSLPDMAKLSVRIARGCEGYWAIMLRLDAQGPFTVSAIDAEGNSDRADVAQYVRRLVKAGIVREARADAIGRLLVADDREKVYALAKRPAAAPRVRRDGSIVGPSDQQRIWTAVRAHRNGFDVAGIAFAAGDEKPLPRTTVTQYLRRLARAGYLAGTHAHYRLKPGMNSGPRAPSVHQVELLWDPNRGCVVGEEHVAEEAA
jgi:hypothetical protein